MPYMTVEAVTVNDTGRGALPIAQAGGGTINTGQVNVGTAATQIAAANGNRFSVVIYNNGTATVYVGTSGVTTGNGHALPAGQAISFKSTAAIYGIVGAGTQTVTYCEEAV